MSLFGILFLVAVLTAIPTFGLSFVALYFCKIWINGNDAKKLSAAASNSVAQDVSITVPFISAAATRKFFNSYGTTEKKYECFNESMQGYIGYVRLDGHSKEHVVMVVSSGRTTVVTSFELPYQFGQDFMSLMAKSEFIKKIISSMSEE